MIKVKYRNIISLIEWDDGEDQLYHLSLSIILLKRIRKLYTIQSMGI